MKTTIKHHCLLAVSLALGCPGTTWAWQQVPTATPESTPVGLPGTYELALTSATGQAYRIFVSEPAAPAPPHGYPVVYVLDGNAWFAHASQHIRMRGKSRPDKSGVLPAVVVGIGYPGDAYINTPRRTLDYTPGVPLQAPNPEGWPPTGGGDAFMSFLQDELKPLIASRFAVDTSREVFFGHSLGGMYALDTYFRHPDAFDAIVAASPSTWWNDEYSIRTAQAFANRHGDAPPATRLMIAMGSDELPMMVTGPERVHALLAPLAAAGADIELAHLADEDHLSAAPAAIGRLIQRYLAPTPADVSHYLSSLPPDRRPSASNGFNTRDTALTSAIDGKSYIVREYIPGGIVPAAVQRTIYVVQEGPSLQAALHAAATSVDAIAVVALLDASGRGAADSALTPTPNSDPALKGGAEDLARLLHDQVVPGVLQRRGHDVGDSLLAGHGRGGMFALYAAANAPDAFGAYAALDPDTRWRNNFILSPNVIGRLQAKLAAQGASTRIRLVSSAAGTEQDTRLLASLQAMDGVDATLDQDTGDAIQALATAMGSAFAMAGKVAPAKPVTFTADTGFPVPSAQEYLAMLPQQRFEMRMKLRGIAKPQQDAWTKAFKFNLDAALWFLEHRLLHEEKERLDEINGYKPPTS